MPVRLPLRLVAVAAGFVALLAAGGCTGEAGARRGQPTSAPATGAADRDVIDFTGLRGIRFGSSLRELSATGRVATEGNGCLPSFVGNEAAHPVFDGDRLVLIWAHPPLRTPEGVMVGSSVDVAKRAYPAAMALTPPVGSTTFPGLLVTGGGDRAYLLLHDQGQVQKLIVGYERYARLLFDTGFGTC
jgi:hypothetical protein